MNDRFQDRLSCSRMTCMGRKPDALTWPLARPAALGRGNVEADVHLRSSTVGRPDFVRPGTSRKSTRLRSTQRWTPSRTAREPGLSFIRSPCLLVQLSSLEG